MLKGQAFDVDIEFMGGTIIFIALALIMFMEILLPLLAVNYSMVTSEEDIKSVVFANLVKKRMIDRIGNGEGDIEYTELGALLGGGLAGIGMAANHVTVEDVHTGHSFDFPGKRATVKHDVYATLYSPYKPVTSVSHTVLVKGEEYIVHIYKTSGTGNRIMLDIYTDAFCDQTENVKERGSFKAIDCDDLPEHGLMDSGVEINLKGMISTVRDNDKDVVAWVKSDSDIDAGDLVLTAMELGSTWECTDSGESPHLCVRMAGDYVSPAKIHIELKKGVDILTQVAK